MLNSVVGSSISIFIDGTLTGSEDIRNLLQLQNRIPYYNLDFSIQSFVKMMESYIKSRMGIDSVFILQDETSNLCYVYIDSFFFEQKSVKN